jgi:hypothetical protein
VERETLMHEILHICFYHCGFGQLLDRAGVNNVGDFEEIVIRMFSPHLTAALETMK